MKITVKKDIDVPAILKARGLGTSTAACKVLATQVARLCEPYVPMSAGSGSHLAHRYTIPSDGSKIEYPGPYAHYQYVGLVMGPTTPMTSGGAVIGYFSPVAPKYYTDQELTYTDSPTRGKEWVVRMMADRGDEVTKAMADYVGGKAK